MTHRGRREFLKKTTALGAAGIREHRMLRNRWRNGRKELRKLRHRRRNEHHVRLARRGGGVGRDGVDDAPLACELEIGARAPGADHMRDLARFPQRQREGAADQPDADDGKAHQSRRLAASAARNFSFSSGVPTVTRRCSGSS